MDVDRQTLDFGSRTATFVLAGGRGERLGALTRHRAKPAVPFAGRHRIIDFTLSNCVNSGFEPVYVLTQHRHESVSRCIAGSWRDRISCLPPAAGRSYRGTADAVRQNLSLLEDCGIEYALVLSADHIYKMDYRVFLRFHRKMKADVSVAAVSLPRRAGRRFGVLQVDAASRIVDFEEKPDDPKTAPDDPEVCLASMGIYVFNAATLVNTLLEDARHAGSTDDFGRDLLPRLIGNCRVSAFQFQAGPHQTAPYWRDVGTTDAYYEAHMELLSGPTPFEFCSDRRWPIHPFDGSPAVPLPGGPPRYVIDSLVCGDSRIAGSVERSIIGPGATIEPGASVQDSILMAAVHVERGACIRGAIVDDGVRVPAHPDVGLDPKRDCARFPVSDGGIVVVPRGTRFSKNGSRSFCASSVVRPASLADYGADRRAGNAGS